MQEMKRKYDEKLKDLEIQISQIETTRVKVETNTVKNRQENNFELPDQEPVKREKPKKKMQQMEVIGSQEMAPDKQQEVVVSSNNKKQSAQAVSRGAPPAKKKEMPKQPVVQEKPVATRGNTDTGIELTNPVIEKPSAPKPSSPKKKPASDKAILPP